MHWKPARPPRAGAVRAAPQPSAAEPPGCQPGSLRTRLEVPVAEAAVPGAGGRACRSLPSHEPQGCRVRLVHRNPAPGCSRDAHGLVCTRRYGTSLTGPGSARFPCKHGTAGHAALRAVHPANKGPALLAQQRRLQGGPHPGGPALHGPPLLEHEEAELVRMADGVDHRRRVLDRQAPPAARRAPPGRRPRGRSSRVAAPSGGARARRPRCRARPHRGSPGTPARCAAGPRPRRRRARR